MLTFVWGLGGMMKSKLLLLPALLLALSSCTGEAGSSDEAKRTSLALDEPADPPWNVVVVLTDDQRWDTLWAMPILEQRVAAEGVLFANTYASTPLCCPFRASFLSGGYLAQNTGVLANIEPNGGFGAFSDENGLAPVLSAGGYKTGMIGKYMNSFPYGDGYEPPGWDVFFAQDAFDVEGFMATEASAFLETYQADPFFLLLNTGNPHYPATPEPEDEELFNDYLYRDRGYGEADITDKPKWVAAGQSVHGPETASQEEEDEFHRNQLRSLQAVDRMIGMVLDKLEALALDQRTVFVFTSDNGYLWGEHGLFAKRWAYDESARVPLVVKMPGAPVRDEPKLAVSNLDVPATIFDLAGIEPPGDGVSLVPLLLDPDAAWRESLFMEHFGSNFPSQLNEVWNAIRTQDADGEWKYIENATGDKELYDLTNDPYELESQHGNTETAVMRAALSAEIAAKKGLAITTLTKKVTGKVGLSFNFLLKAWGGEGNYTWSIESGTLPAGLELDTDTGLISGVPCVAGDELVRVRVEDTKIARYTNEPQRFLHEFTLSIAAGTPVPCDDTGAAGAGGASGSGGGDAGGEAGADAGSGGEAAVAGAGGAGGAGSDGTTLAGAGGVSLEPARAGAGGVDGDPLPGDGGGSAEGGATDQEANAGQGGTDQASAEGGASSKEGSDASATDDGCSCRVPAGPGSNPSGWLLAMVAAVGWSARRRRGSKRA
jgi:MYXO-CTERM domain-containing protein